jgi:hypothetical protein
LDGSRVTTFGGFSPLGRSLTLAIFCKLTISSRKWTISLVCKARQDQSRCSPSWRTMPFTYY